MSKPAKYPPHLFTLEIHFNGTIPIFSRHFPTEAEARQVLQSLSRLSGGTIERLRLWHKHSILSSASPNIKSLSSPKPLPPPDTNQIRHIPSPTRQLTNPYSSRPLSDIGI